MIIYNVTLSIDLDIEQEFIEWLKKEHIPELFETNLFLEHKILRLIDEENPKAKTYAVQYFLESIESFLEYTNKYASQMQAKTKEKYGDKVVGFRTLLEVID